MATLFIGHVRRGFLFQENLPPWPNATQPATLPLIIPSSLPPVISLPSFYRASIVIKSQNQAWKTLVSFGHWLDVETPMSIVSSWFRSAGSLREGGGEVVEDQSWYCFAWAKDRPSVESFAPASGLGGGERQSIATTMSETKVVENNGIVREDVLVLPGECEEEELIKKGEEGEIVER